MAFPSNGPATRAGTKVQLSIPDANTSENARIDAIVAAVNAKVLGWPVALVADDADDWTGADVQHLVLGANMLAARIHRRRNNPDGVASLGSDVVGVALGDPEIAFLLQIDNNTTPMVG